MPASVQYKLCVRTCRMVGLAAEKREEYWCGLLHSLWEQASAHIGAELVTCRSASLTQHASFLPFVSLVGKGKS